MIFAGTLIWTKRGWLKSEELIIGDTIISYNPSRNCTEYDEVKHINMEYGSYTLYGLRNNSMNMAITPDHPLILLNRLSKIAERKTIDDVFLSSLRSSKHVLYTSPFEPYLVGQELDDVIWSARVAVGFSFVRYMPIEYADQIWHIIREASALEAQHWIDTFFHWNVLEGGTYWSKAVKLRNRQVRDMIFHLVPRAGFGARFMPNPKKPTGPWIMGLAHGTHPHIFQENWFRDRKTSHVFNIGTKNGSFLALNHGGTFLCACDEV